jgi:3-methylcrotonyl-CoA carboxylase beta subunit
MSTIETQLDPRDAMFAKNRDAMTALVADLRAKVAAIELGGGDASRTRHTGRGKLLPRERIQALLDAGSPILEFSQFAAYGMYDDNIAAAGIITGIGRVSGRECVIVCNDATVKGGTYYPMTVKKHLRAQGIARETTSRASIWSIPVGESAEPDRNFGPRSFRPRFSTIRRRCRRKVFRRSRS